MIGVKDGADVENHPPVLVPQRRMHRAQTFCAGSMCGRPAYEVVVIRKDRPGFQLPVEVARHSEQSPVQNLHAPPALEVMVLLICGRRNEKSARISQPMLRRMRPRNLALGHLATMRIPSSRRNRRVTQSTTTLAKKKRRPEAAFLQLTRVVARSLTSSSPRTRRYRGSLAC